MHDGAELIPSTGGAAAGGVISMYAQGGGIIYRYMYVQGAGVSPWNRACISFASCSTPRARSETLG